MKKFSEILKEGVGLSPAEMYKYDYRAELFLDKIKKGEPFTLVKGGKVVFQKDPEVMDALKLREPLKGIMLTSEDGKQYKFSDVLKTVEFGGRGAKGDALTGTERQELGLIAAIDANAPIKVKNVKGVIQGASKNDGLSSIGKEPYVDVFLDANKKIGVSCKGTSAPSLAGGGLAGMEVIAPKFVKEAYDKIIKYLEKSGLQHDHVYDVKELPDMYIEIPKQYLRMLIEGTAKMGGPIQYMYVGPMDVSYKVKGDTMELNGDFISIDDYIKKVGTLFLRVRKRDLDSNKMVRVNYKSKGKSKYPQVFASPKTGKNNMRFVIVDKKSISSKGVKL